MIMKNTLHQITSGDLTVCIDENGAELRSIYYRGHEYLWQPDPAYWEEQSPVLFPYVGRFTDGRYTLDGKTYELPIHGFAKDCLFEVAEEQTSQITFLLQDSDSSRAVYPYPFQFFITYEAGQASLSVTYEVVNCSDRLMYFGIGGHPAFQVPLEDGLCFEDYRLVFSRPHLPTRVGQTPSCFLSGVDHVYQLENGTDIPLHHDLFDEDAIVLRNVADTVTLKSNAGSRSVTMHYPHLHYLGIWHMPKTDAPYVCIEPWSSLPSRQDIVEEFSCKSDLIRLPSQQKYRTGWQLELT